MTRNRKVFCGILVGILLSYGIVFTPEVSAADPTIHALLVIMDGDPLNAKQYKKSAGKIEFGLLKNVQQHTVCNIKLTALRSGADNEQEWPTRARIFRWISEVNAQPNDVVFVYFCGHGAKLSDVDNNRDLKDHEFGGTFFDLDGESLFRKRLVDALKASSAWGCRLKMLITDTCSKEIDLPPIEEGEILLSPPPFPHLPEKEKPIYRHLFVEHEGFLHLTSASEDEYSWGDNERGTWFTYRLVKSIDDSVSASRTKFITWEKVLEDTKTEVKKLIKGNRDQVGTNKQNPKSYGALPTNRQDTHSDSNRTDETSIRGIKLKLSKVTDERPLQFLQIHVQFNAGPLRAEEVKVQAYFFHKDGRILKDADSESEKQYGAVNGQVSTGEKVKTDATEATLQIPTSQLHLGKGEHPLHIVAVIRSLDGEELVRSSKGITYTVK